MLKRIELKNFRKFPTFRVKLGRGNMLVGPNNSGKSSILDAFRLTSDLMRVCKRRRPEIASHEKLGVCAKYALPPSSLSISLENICNDYSDDNAEIVVYHENGNYVYFEAHPTSGVTAYLIGPSQLPRTSAAFFKAFPTKLAIVPTLTPFEKEEQPIKPETIRANMNTRLASRNFRNIWMSRTADEIFFICPHDQRGVA